MASDGNLRAMFRANLPDFDWLSVETHGTSRGVPDSNYCVDGKEGWIELKACDGWRVSIRPEQAAWAELRLRKGGRVFLAVRRAKKELWLFSGAAMRLLIDARLDATAPLGRWEGGPRSWDWRVVRFF